MFIPDKKKDIRLYIKDGTILKKEKVSGPFQTFQLGENTYWLYGAYSSKDLYCNGEVISDKIGGGGNNERVLFPATDGLILSNPGGENTLYYIYPDGRIELMFPEIDGVGPYTALTVYGNYVFLSFKRVSGLDESKKKYEFYDEDTLSGTYRIDIRDKSYVKISDTYYEGLYVFDDTGVYCTTNKGLVQKLDFDGNVVATILTP